jgi:hypothetical protein
VTYLFQQLSQKFPNLDGGKGFKVTGFKLVKVGVSS